MKKKITLLLMGFSLFCNAQSTIQTINSASFVSAGSLISIGEINVSPTNPNQPNSGIIGILAQINQQSLEVNQFEIAENISVFPNPTTSKIYFNSSEVLTNEKIKIYNTSGELIFQTQIDSNNSLDLDRLSSGIYLIDFQSKKLKSFKIIKH
jgi:hypothetical protein